MNEKRFFDCIRIGNYTRHFQQKQVRSTLHYMKKLKTEGTVVYKARSKRKLTEREEKVIIYEVEKRD